MAILEQEQFSIKNLFNIKINLSALIVATILIFICIRFLTLLPEKYYFGFAKMVDSSVTHEFIVTPPSITNDEYLALLERNGYNEFSRFIEPAEGSNTQLINHDERQLEITEQIIAAGQFNFWIAFLLKMLPPFVVGYFLFFIWKEDAMFAVPTGAALTAFLMSWPVILMWDQVVYQVWDKQHYLFIVLYLAYILLYYHLARLGCIIAKFTFQAGFVRDSKIELDWGKAISSLISTGVTTGITWIVTMAIAKA